MSADSRISTGRPYKVLPFSDAVEYSQRLTTPERARFWHDQWAPPIARRRKREARRWLDLLIVLSSNPCRSERRPGDGWLTIAEGIAIRDRANAQLRQSDPELYRAVERVKWDDSIRNEGITLDAWKRNIARGTPRLARLREDVRCVGPHPLTWPQTWAILSVRPGRFFQTTAEVAERQTR